MDYIFNNFIPVFNGFGFQGKTSASFNKGFKIIYTFNVFQIHKYRIQTPLFARIH